VRVGQSGWNRSRRRAEFETGAADEGIIEMGFRDEEWCGSGGGRRRRGRLWWREEKLETRSRKVEVRKWKLESESGWSDGEAESGGCLHR